MTKLTDSNSARECTVPPAASGEQKSAKGILIMLASSACVCVGQLLWKLSAERGYVFMLAGFVIYAVGAMLMLYAYRFGRLSVLQPILSANYVFSTILGVVVLKEQFSVRMLIGIVVIAAGVVLIGSGARSGDPTPTERK